MADYTKLDDHINNALGVLKQYLTPSPLAKGLGISQAPNSTVDPTLIKAGAIPSKTVENRIENKTSIIPNLGAFQPRQEIGNREDVGGVIDDSSLDRINAMELEGQKNFDINKANRIGEDIAYWKSQNPGKQIPTINGIPRVPDRNVPLEVIKGNQREAYHFAPDGSTIQYTEAENPWTEANKKAKEDDLYNRATSWQLNNITGDNGIDVNALNAATAYRKPDINAEVASEKNAMLRQNFEDRMKNMLEIQKMRGDQAYNVALLRALKGEGSPNVQQTMFVDPTTGSPLVFDKSSGTYRVASVNSPGVAPRPTNPSASEREKTAALTTISEQLRRVNSTYNPQYVGLVSGRMGKVSSLLDSKEAAFRQNIDDIKDSLLRARSGAQINEQEYKRLATLVPSYNDTPAQFSGKMKSFKETLKTLTGARLGAQRSGGVYVGGGGRGVGGNGRQIKVGGYNGTVEQE